MRECDHVGAAHYRSLDGSQEICYRCGRDMKSAISDPEPEPEGEYPPLAAVDSRPEPSTNKAGKVGREHPDTAQAAAARIMPASGTQRSKVLDRLTSVSPGGMTDEELQASLEMNPNSQRPRRVELVEQGWIEDSGDRRKTVSGADSIVWRYRP